MRALALNDGAQRRAVGHRHDMRTVRDLHAGRVGVTIDGNRLDTEALQGDNHLFAQFAGAEQHDACGCRT